MGFKILAGPSIEAVVAADLRDHLKISDTAEDTLFTSYCKTARQYAEQYLNRSMISQSCQISLDEFPDDDVIELMYSPGIAVTEFKYTDTDGVVQDLASSVFELDNISTPSRIILKYDQEFPATANLKNAVKITYTAGFGTAVTDVPQRFKSAILLLAAEMENNRENWKRRFPSLAEQLLKFDRIHYYGG